MKNNIKSFSQVVKEEVRNEKELRIGGTMNPHSGVKEDKWKKMWGWSVKESISKFAHLQFNIEDDKLQRFEKTCV